MKILYRLLKQDPDTRDGAVTVTSALGIIVNVVIATVKVIIGALAGSIAIISEGVNNATDAFTSVLALLGAKLSRKRPDAKHPFGYGRIEYLTGLVIAGLILFSGIELLISSVQLVFEPQELGIDYVALIIIAVSAVIKFALGVYTIKTGKRVGSCSLVGVGKECRNDSFASAITIATAIVFIIFGLNIDAYAGIVTSAIIIKAGVEVLKETLAELLGRPGKKELAQQLYKVIRATDGVINAADLILHNYGPEAYSGSINVELDHEKSVGEVYAVLHDLQLRIMQEYHVTMVFGIYAVDNDHADSRAFREYIARFVRSHEHVLSYHAVYIDRKANRMYCDLTVDYDLKDWDGLRQEFVEYMALQYPDQEAMLTIETDFV